MAKKSERTRIEFDYDGTHYILEYTAASIKKMEADGIKFGSMGDSIFTNTEKLFFGAFQEHHPTTSRKKAKEIYRALSMTAEDEEPETDDDGNPVDGLTKVLTAMLDEAMDEMLERGGNVSWKVTR
jgi:hypothetical protein